MHWFENPRFEQVALLDLKPGDVVHLPAAFWDGQPVWWHLEPLRITGAEQKSPGVWFLHLDLQSIKPGHMPFTMLCGQYLAAGVLRQRPATTLEDTTMKRPFYYLADHDQSGRALFSSNTEARNWLEYQTDYHHARKATHWVDGGEHGWQALRLADGTSVAHIYALQLDQTLPDDLDDED